MPELPEAEVVARQLRSTILNAVIDRSLIGRCDIVREGVETVPWYDSARISHVERRGKSVVIVCERHHETRFLVAELGMTGLLFFRPPDPSYDKHTHFILELSGVEVPSLRYWNPRRFGRLYFLDAEGLARFTARRFGYDPLAIKPEEFASLMKHSRARLKPLLMHQQIIAGIGNIYANEILFRAKLHPNAIANRLGTIRLHRLFTVMREVLNRAIEEGGSSVRDFFAPDWTKGRYKLRHQVYNRAGLPCLNACGNLIKRMHGERTSFYCPRCQRW